ncbi:hypothetical protein [Sphingobacterium sp.]|uniref:hypothetical protein n=1 Tax=Sphingobacterium sp. TaxID=341027 RepID=UPI0028A9A478|nr:hypothetical protein [Sphingobacterium sp.]
MACESLLAYVGKCGDSILAGTKNTYMIAYNDLDKIAGSTSVYTLSAGIVSAITLDTGKKFVKVRFTPKTESTNETITRAENGVVTGNGTFSASILGFTKEGATFVKSLMGQEVVILQELASGDFVASGLDGGYYMTEAVGQSTATESGYNVTFGGAIYGFSPTVDKTLVSSLIA